jgi:Ca-activated chloride channel family protein
MLHRAVIFSAVFATLPMGGFATALCSDDAMIVFDGSGSMSYEGFNGLEEARIKEARRAVGRSIPWIAQFRRLGLIIYGPGLGDSCANIDLRFGPTADAAKLIIDEIETVSPAGMTALTNAVRQAAEELSFKSQSATVVLVTDGQETCGGAPCAMADWL